MELTPEHIITILTSIAAIAGAVLALWKARQIELPTASASFEKTNVETINSLSAQLNEAYKQIDELRGRIDDLDTHKDYEEYLLRGIQRLTASLAANEISVPWMPLSFEDFKKRQQQK